LENIKTIALVSNTSWSLYNFRLGLIRHLKSQGFRIVVIAPKDAFTAKLIAEGIDYKEIEIFNYGTNPVYEIKLIFSLIHLYKAIKPDLIFHYTIKPNIYGSIAARYCGIPSIIITTGLGHLFEFKNWMVRAITIFLYRIACHLSKESWFLNSNDLDVFVYKLIVKKSKTLLLKSEGIDLDWFSPRSASKHPKTTIFLYAGRLLVDKGILVFRDAAETIKRKYHHVEFQVLGFVDQSNPNSIEYERLLEWQKKKVIIYLGETTDVRPYLANCDCLVFPSYYREGVSRILMEASAMERPIITTDNVGCREVVDNGINGFVIPVRDTQSLVKVMEEFLQMNKTDREIMGKAGRRKMEREFDEALVLNVYDQAIARYLLTGEVESHHKKVVQ
jgi:glycosyltransferase involved in cell wall biosynthesis